MGTTKSVDERRLSAAFSLAMGTHEALRKLAAERGLPMSRVVEDLVQKESRDRNSDSD